MTLCSSLIESKQNLFTIMIDPAGDAKHTGRLIQDTLERGISLQCSEELKRVIMNKHNNIRVILTRVPGEVIQPLQNASFANRLHVDLYLRIDFYEEQDTPAHITLYHYLENPTADYWYKPIHLCFYQANQAHLMHLDITKKWGLAMLDVLHNKQILKHFEPQGFFGVPFQPLVGVQAPAIAVEVGLKNKKDWQYLIEPLVQAIERIIP